MKTLEELDLKGKRVFVRVDFNVPTDDQGNITDDTRIRAHLPTIAYITEKRGKAILASHLGRPKGKRNEKYTLRPVAKKLSDLLFKGVTFVDDCIGEKVQSAVAAMKEGDVLLLENLRFYPGEEKNDKEFSRELAKLCDVYVDDAFATAHRGHASNAGITEFVSTCAVGMLLKSELDYLKRATDNPVRPMVAIIGGAKVSDKIGVLEKLIDRVDKLIVGGGMAFTFLKALGYEVGKSLCETDMLDVAKKILEKARAKKVKFYLPVDCVLAEQPSADAATKQLPVEEIPPLLAGYDIGPATSTLFSEALQDAKTIVWNGPMGMFEVAPFRTGTFALAASVAATDALTIVGGGDTDTAVHQAGVANRISYISTGGGAFLELLEGKPMPAIEALERRGGGA
ncbi:MAG TPA: phosphoglycerate kinase [Syntrophorhabdales bacterium]|nr:phosphoglycerate kinase [Syntrophorhabdales bacterium]